MKATLLQHSLSACQTAAFALLLSGTTHASLLSDDQEVLRLAHDDEETIAFPVETRVETKQDNHGHTRVRVTLIFPDNGHEVTDWGEIEHHGNEFSVSVEAVRTDDGGVFPVLTPISHVYDLGPLATGEYVFDVWSRGRLLAHQPFEIRDDDGHAFPARARLAVFLHGHHGGVLDAAIRFREPGWTVTDWGEPLRRGMDWTIHVQAERHDPPEDREHDGFLREERHRYLLGDLDQGRHRLQFFVNDHLLARTAFAVPEFPLGLSAEPLTEPRRAHPLHLHIKLDSHGIDPDSLGDHNLRVVGPHGYDRPAHFVDWHVTATGVLVARYHALPPGDLWSARDNGRYRVALRPNSLRNGEGDFIPGQQLGDFEVAIETEPGHPLPALHSFVPLSDTDTGSYTGRLTILLAASNIVVEDWGTMQRHRRHFWVDVRVVQDGDAGFPVVREESHDYHLGPLAPGDYRFSLYSRGHYIDSVRFVIEDGDGPVARVRSAPITEPSDHPHLFRVFYHSPAGMDLDSIRETILRVTGPNDFGRPARVLSVENYTTLDGEQEAAVAVYAVEPPAGGWTFWANGLYAIFAPHDAIHDHDGNFLPGGRIGGFHVAIPEREPEPGEPVVSLSFSEEDEVHFVDVSFDPNNTGWRIERWGDLRLRTHTFVAPVEIDEDVGNTEIQHKTYRLGRLRDGLYAFVLRGSNGFVFRESFMIGDSPVEPFEQWRTAAVELLEEDGRTPDEIERLLDLGAYAFARDPRDASLNPVRITRHRDDGGPPRLTLTYTEAPSATDLSYRIEAAEHLGAWTDITDLLFARAVAISPDGDHRYTIDWPDETLRFLRVRAARHR